jgi:nucleotide-binding universal stress UspA family protein
MTLQLRKILVPIDFSPIADRALAVAREQAIATGAELSLLFVFPTRASLDGPGALALTDQILQEQTLRARKLLEQRLLRFADARFTSHGNVVGGRPHEEILRAAEAEHVDLIVMGSHGRTGLARLALGSVAARVVAAAPCPVLLVPRASDDAESKEVSS